MPDGASICGSGPVVLCSAGCRTAPPRMEAHEPGARGILVACCRRGTVVPAPGACEPAHVDYAAARRWRI